MGIFDPGATDGTGVAGRVPRAACVSRAACGSIVVGASGVVVSSTGGSVTLASAKRCPHFGQKLAPFIRGVPHFGQNCAFPVSLIDLTPFPRVITDARYSQPSRLGSPRSTIHFYYRNNRNYRYEPASRVAVSREAVGHGIGERKRGTCSLRVSHSIGTDPQCDCSLIAGGALRHRVRGIGSRI